MRTRREYVFDMPSKEWLRNWFLVSLFGVLGLSFAVAILVRLVLGARFHSTQFHWLFWSLAFVLGAIGTTLVSRWMNDFVFTWHVSIFVAFQAVVYQLKFVQKQATDGSNWRGRVVALLFIACCIGYFLICRRVSLVIEWVFLCGFAAALPLAIVGAAAFRNRRWRIVWECAWTVAAFTAFYWSAVLILVLKAPRASNAIGG